MVFTETPHFKKHHDGNFKYLFNIFWCIGHFDVGVYFFTTNHLYQSVLFVFAGNEMEFGKNGAGIKLTQQLLVKLPSLLADLNLSSTIS